MTTVVLVILVVVGYVGYQRYEARYHPPDYSGQGSAPVTVLVHSGDGADAIGATLQSQGIVKSKRAFTNVAAKNSSSSTIAAGVYRLRAGMSAQAALNLLLDPASRLSNTTVVFEGATVFDVVAPLAKSLSVSVAAATAAIKNVGALNLPNGYMTGSSAPTTVEGFLFPATYTFDASTSPTEALTQMITQFIDQDRSLNFAADAQTAHLTPYQALIVASIAEKEAKMAPDYPKVARVILNRIAAGMPLQIDATSAYAAKQQGLDPTKVIYATIVSPYNTYTHPGLPPSPIANPGTAAMTGAVHPAAGDWLYYVNGDQAGDLSFFHNAADFETAVAKCRQNNWGCG
ncbi:MAG: endolytic transglycosylase MltG [Actinomycetota bacterium]|nr:endolytic transglycosylase MltG [Actinomycetota bacterium]